MQSFQYTPYASPLALASLIAAVLAIYIWDRRHVTGAKPAVALMIALFVWSASYMLEFMGADLETKLFWAKIQYFGIAALPLAAFLFALDFSGRSVWLTSSKFFALAALPAITLILALSNEFHHLIWADWHMETLMENTSVLRFEYGPFFWANSLYAYGLLIAGTVLIVQALNRRPDVYRGQILSILVGYAFPWLTNVVSNLVYDIDLTPFAFIVTSIAFAWSIFRHHLFESPPNAFETVIESMSDPVFILDMRNRIVNANPAAQQMLGLPASEVVDHQTTEVFARQTDILDIYEHAVNIREEITIGPESQRHYYELSISPLTDRLDKILGRAIILHDISDRKQIENAMVMTRDRAVESSRIKSEFLARVSHELRTPLGVIRGYADLLSEPVYGTLSELQSKAVSEIIDSTERISDMVGELLDEARLAAGAVQLEIKSFKPAEVLEDVKEKMSVLANQKKLELAAELDSELPPQIVGDPTRIYQMVTNLTSNSIKFTKKGKVGIRFYLHDTDQWAMEVTDTGPGIPKEAHESIFEPFTQADSSIPRIFGGTGLGLSIVKHLTNLMDGKITVESDVGSGSTFTVFLPLNNEAPE
ncbi:MAG: histidine kinase N-terminal 7TM domain-containing protein [Anaerolineales bacterium]